MINELILLVRVTHTAGIQVLHHVQCHALTRKLSSIIEIVLERLEKIEIRLLIEYTRVNSCGDFVYVGMCQSGTTEWVLLDVWVQEYCQDEHILISLGPTFLKAA